MSEEEFDELLNLMSENDLTQHGADTLYGEIVSRGINARLEIERLNNIINELERKMLNDKLYIEDISKKQPYPIEEFRIRNPYTTGSYDTCVNYLGKIKELKGVDKE